MQQLLQVLKSFFSISFAFALINKDNFVEHVITIGFLKWKTKIKM